MTALMWGFWCLLHSLLNSDAISGKLRRGIIPDRYYRLFYNFTATASLILVSSLTPRRGESVLFGWNGGLHYLQIALWALALFVGYLSFRKFGFTDFLGISSMLKKDHGPDQGLVTTGIYGVIRHPLFVAALILVWAREIKDTDLAVNAILSIYLLLGAKIEEHRLTDRFGRQHIDYLNQVPGFIPRVLGLGFFRKRRG